MKKLVKTVDEKQGIVQITIADERWYVKTVGETVTYVPSVTWIAGKYPKGIQFYKWLAEKGWDESQAIKEAAGTKGSKIHDAIGDVIMGKEVRIDSQYLNRSNEKMEELTLEECDAVLSFVQWKKDFEEDYILETITYEYTIFNEKQGYAGTVDWVIKTTNKSNNVVQYFIIDFKTGQSIWTEYELQISAYREALTRGYHEIEALKDIGYFETAILQVGYRKNKSGYKFTEIDNVFDLFMHAKAIWENEHGGEQPTKKDYPIILSPELTISNLKK